MPLPAPPAGPAAGAGARSVPARARSASRIGPLLRFGAVGVANTGLYLVLYLLFGTVLPYMGAHVCALALAMTFSYFMNCYVTFRTAPSLRTFLLFPLSNVGTLVVTTGGLPLAVQVLGVDERVAPVPVALLAVPVTYLIARTVMLGPRRSGEPAATGGPQTPDERHSRERSSSR